MRHFVYNMLISNNRASFHLWWKDNLLKHQKVSECYESGWESGPSPQICFIFKIFRVQSCLMGAYSSLTKYTNFKCIPVICHSSLTLPLVKDQSSFYEIRSLAICINIKVLNRVNRVNSWTLWKYFWNIWNFILLLTDDDSALKVA